MESTQAQETSRICTMEIFVLETPCTWLTPLGHAASAVKLSAPEVHPLWRDFQQLRRDMEYLTRDRWVLWLSAREPATASAVTKTTETSTETTTMTATEQRMARLMEIDARLRKLMLERRRLCSLVENLARRDSTTMEMIQFFSRDILCECCKSTEMEAWCHNVLNFEWEGMSHNTGTDWLPNLFGSIKSAAMLFTETGSSTSKIYFSGFDTAFFDAGENLAPSEIEQKLIQSVKDGHKEVEKSSGRGVFANFRVRFEVAAGNDPYETLRLKYMDRCPLFKQVTRAWKNANSAEIILTTSSSSELPKGAVYPFCNVDLGEEMGFARTFQVDKPSEINLRDDIDRLIGGIKNGLPNKIDKIRGIYVGYLSRHAKQNIYFPKDGGEKGQVGIVIVPDPELYEEYLDTGSITGIPRRIPLCRGNDDVAGFIPVSIMDPAFI